MPPDRYSSRLEALGLYSADQYHEAAFARNIGLFTRTEQERLRQAKIAIPGMGGVGGVHLVTMARTGIGNMHLADFDRFEPVNINRQYGARVPDLGRPKLDVMMDEARAINPYLNITPFPAGLTEANMDEFLDGVEVVLDGLDFFQFDIRRQLFNRAQEKGVYVVTAAPLGFSAAVLIFSPHEGMRFDEYFNITSGMSERQRYLSFGMGLTPRATQLNYMDLSRVDLESKAGPSLNIACQICAGMAATEAVRIILKRGRIKPVPYFFQFDPYAQKYRRGKLHLGNRNPVQKVKIKAADILLARNKVLFRRPIPETPPIPIADPGTISEANLRSIIQAGIQAPSGDNAQPWKFAWQGNTIDLSLDRDADHSFFNVRQVASILSCGAVLENMCIAARALGFEPQVTYLPAGASADHMASVTLTAGKDAHPWEPLFESVWERNTNRTFYRKKALPDLLTTRMHEAVTPYEGVHIHLLTESADLRKLAGLIYKVDRIRTEHRPLHQHLCKMIRFTDQEAIEKRDGLPLKNLEAGLAGELFLKLTRPWPVMWMANTLGLGRMVALHAMAGVLRSSGAALITVDGMDPGDFLLGGRALQRAWLTLTREGLNVQPMAAMTLFRTRWVLEGEGGGFSVKHQALLREVWRRYDGLFPGVDFSQKGQVMLFRFGYGRPMRYGTHRKKDEMLIG